MPFLCCQEIVYGESNGFLISSSAYNSNRTWHLILFEEAWLDYKLLKFLLKKETFAATDNAGGRHVHAERM